MAFRRASVLALCLAACDAGILGAPPLPGDAARHDLGVRAMIATPAAVGDPLAMSPPDRTGAFIDGAADAGLFGTKGSGAPKGVLSWSGMAPAGVDAIAIPVVAGPRVRGLSVRVSVDGEDVAVLQPRMTTLMHWRVALGAADRARKVRITAIDENAAPDAWLAIGQPGVALSRTR